jgi:hypothetical protein
VISSPSLKYLAKEDFDLDSFAAYSFGMKAKLLFFGIGLSNYTSYRSTSESATLIFSTSSVSDSSLPLSSSGRFLPLDS